MTVNDCFIRVLSCTQFSFSSYIVGLSVTILNEGLSSSIDYNLSQTRCYISIISIESALNFYLIIIKLSYFCDIGSFCLFYWIIFIPMQVCKYCFGKREGEFVMAMKKGFLSFLLHFYKSY